MMKRITTLAAVIAMSLSSISLADDCSWWQSKMNSATNKISKGGNQSQVKRWEQERDYYAKSLEQCNKRNGTHKWVQSISGKRENKTTYTRESLRPIKTDNPQLQQVIKTCNFWIQQYNQNPNDDTQAMKNTACRHADNMATSASEDKPEAQFKPTRSLKECVKPKNVIDRDVKLCMQGLKEPTWIAVKQ